MPAKIITDKVCIVKVINLWIFFWNLRIFFDKWTFLEVLDHYFSIQNPFSSQVNYFLMFFCYIFKFSVWMKNK